MLLLLLLLVPVPIKALPTKAELHQKIEFQVYPTVNNVETYILLARYGGGYSVFDSNKKELSFNLSSTDALAEAGVNRSTDIVKEMAETENGWEDN